VRSITLAVLFFVMAMPIAVCEDKDVKPTPPAAAKEADKAPAVTDAMKLAYFKALARKQDAQNSLEQAQKYMQEANVKFQQAVQDITKTCGEKYVAQFDAQGDPACVLKPVTPKSADKK